MTREQLPRYYLHPEDGMFGKSSGRIDLPSVPATLARIIQITNSFDASADDVASVVMLDQALATKVLRIANSAFYGRRMKCESITQAVVTLGFTSIRNLAASASVVDALFPKQMFPGFSWQDMWVHSVTCAVSSETLHSRMPSASMANAEAAFIGGLLHDVGKLIFARALSDRFRQIVEICSATGREMHEAEIELLSMDHARVGGELAEEWGFSDKLHDAIAFHHAPQEAYQNEDIVLAVCGGNMLAKCISSSYIAGPQRVVPLEGVAYAVGIDPESMGEIVEEVRERMQECSEILACGNDMPASKVAA